MNADDESLVDLRCPVVVVHDDRFLLLHRQHDDRDDWVLPGGRPRPGEGMAARARREAHEETGLHVNPTRCAFVLEVIQPGDQRRVVELVFLGSVDDHGIIAGEPGTTAHWVPLERLSELRLRPPIAGYLPALARGNRGTAPYLGNMWRPEESAQWERASLDNGG